MSKLSKLNHQTISISEEIATSTEFEDAVNTIETKLNCLNCLYCPNYIHGFVCDGGCYEHKSLRESLQTLDSLLGI